MSAFALSEVLGALSYALDITEGEPPGHAVRTLSIGMRIAEEPLITSGSTARATTSGCRPSISRGRRGSWPWPTSSTR